MREFPRTASPNNVTVPRHLCSLVEVLFQGKSQISNVWAASQRLALLEAARELGESTHSGLLECNFWNVRLRALHSRDLIGDTH